MSKGVQGHPGAERLLRLADGELNPRQSAAVRDHLEACWDCRAEMELIQGAVSDCVHYRKSVLQAHLPAPPGPWPSLSAGFAAVDREIAGESSWWRVVWQSVSRPGFWVPALAAGLLVTFVLVPWLRVTPTVQAAELLRRAVEAAEARPVAAAPPGGRRLQIRTGSKKLVYSPAAGLPADVRPVAALFAAARYDWSDPLSAKAYLDWHNRLGTKTDEVIPDGDQFYRVHTRSDEGEMTEATLRLRQGDLQPVQGTFKFRGDEWVELTEALPEPEPDPVAAKVTPLLPSAPVSLDAEPPALASLADELRVMEALHAMGADLGDPIEITRSGARVEVKAFGIAGRRRAQLEQALRVVPVANLRFVDEAAPAGALGAAGNVLAVKPAGSPIQSYLEERLGGRAGVEQLGNDVFDRYEAIMARAHAIDRLSARFASAELSPAERASYRAMQRSHAEALLQLEQELAGALSPVIPGSAAPVLPTGQANGQAILPTARRLEGSISMMLGASALTGVGADALTARVGIDAAALRALTRSFLESMGQ